MQMYASCINCHYQAEKNWTEGRYESGAVVVEERNSSDRFQVKDHTSLSRRDAV